MRLVRFERYYSSTGAPDEIHLNPERVNWVAPLRRGAVEIGYDNTTFVVAEPLLTVIERLTRKDTD